MADEPEGGTKRPIEQTEETLEGIAVLRDGAAAAVKTANDTITASKTKINRLEKEIRGQEGKLPELEQRLQDAQKQVDDLLTHLEEQVGLDIERLEPAGPVVQGGTAKYKATLKHPLPEQARLSWDTGGCPFTLAGDTITVETGAVGPGDYNVSVKLEWVNSPEETEPSVSTRSAKALK